MFCPNCGEKNNLEDDKFCGSCGVFMDVRTGSFVPKTQGEKNEEEAGHLLASEQIVSELSDYEKKDLLTAALRKAAKSEVLKGFGWFAVALVITGITYALAEPGSTYFVFYGAMIYGVYRLLRGIYYWIFPKQLLGKIVNSLEENTK